MSEITPYPAAQRVFLSLIYDIYPSDEHGFLMTTKEAANAFDCKIQRIGYIRYYRKDKFIEGTHFLKQHKVPSTKKHLSSLNHSQLYWTREGLILLASFLRSERAKKFAEWTKTISFRPEELHPIKTEEESSEESSNPAIEIRVFEHAQFGKIRTVIDDDGEPWFVAIDLARILGYISTSYITKRIDEDQKIIRLLPVEGSNYKTGLATISEYAFARIVLARRKPEARIFYKWVTDEVLPSLRNNSLECQTIPEEQTEEAAEVTPVVTPPQFPAKTNDIQAFEHPHFGKMRIIDKDGEPWFVAKDVAEALGYKNPNEAVREHCKGVSETLTPTKGGNQKVKIIPESDLYRLVLRSKLPDAERFQDWVVEDVLPSIRKTGAYVKNEIKTKHEQINTDSKAKPKKLYKGNHVYTLLKLIAGDALIEIAKGEDSEILPPSAVLPKEDNLSNLLSANTLYDMNAVLHYIEKKLEMHKNTVFPSIKYPRP